MSDIFVTYPGGKNGSGMYQKIINLMPPHRMYVEAFLGGGAILRAKRPALVNVGIELNKAVVQEWNHVEISGGIPNLTVYWFDGVQWLRDHADELLADCLVYCDPPYLMSTRSSQRQLYAIDMAEAEQHRNLIEVLRGLKCMVMISGYWSQLYADLLPDWRTYSFQAITRGGTMATEWVWMNFPEPFALHDYQYLGDTFRERERIKRKKVRWVERLGKMDRLERMALLNVIGEYAGSNAVGDDGRRPTTADKVIGCSISGRTDEGPHRRDCDAISSEYPGEQQWGNPWRNEWECDWPGDDVLGGGMVIDGEAEGK
jgi:DNA adenine methylase